MKKESMELMFDLVAQMMDDGELDDFPTETKVAAIGMAFARTENKMKDLMRADKLSEEQLTGVLEMYRKALGELKSILGIKPELVEKKIEHIKITDIDEN